MRRFALLFHTLILLAPFVSAQDDALQLMKSATATSAGLSKRSYDFEQVEATQYSGTMQNRSEQRRRIVGSGGRYREESLPSGVLYLFDGQYRWVYNPERNEYTKASASAGFSAFLNLFEASAYRIKSARFLPPETLDLTSGPVLCKVVEVEREPAEGSLQYSPLTYWIDTSRNLVLKVHYKYTAAAGGPNPSTSDITVSLARAELDGPVDDSLLRFTPPAGALQVENLTFGPKSMLIGKDSPEFELKVADGTRITNAAWKGRAVLLYFGTSPASDSLLLLEMAYRAFKNNGLAAMYIARQDPGRLANAYTVPVASDPGGAAAKKFGISYEGMVLIDPLGKIAYADSSSRNSTELIAAMRAIGIW